MKKKSPASSMKNLKPSDWLKPRRTVNVVPQEAVTLTIALKETSLVGFARPV
jgi:hypothetical protein